MAGIDDSAEETGRIHIAFAIWVIMFLQQVIFKSMGVLLPVLLEQFKTYTRNVGAVVSLTYFSGTLIGLAAQVITKVISKRALVIICGISCSTGLLVCASAHTINVLVIGMFFTGLVSTGVVVAFGQISTYFQIYQNTAANFISTATPLAITISAPLTQLLLDAYGWKGALWIIGGLSTHFIAAACIMKPLENTQSNHQKMYKPLNKYEHDKDEPRFQIIQEIIRDVLNVSLLFNFRFQAVLVMCFVSGYLYNGWIVYLVSIAQSKGLSPVNSANVTTIGGFGAFVVRIVLVILQGKSAHYRYLFLAGSVLIIISYIGIYFSSSFWVLSMMALLIGLSYGIMGAQIIIGVNANVEKEDAVSGVAWAHLTQGIGYITSGYVSGMLFDLTGTFSLAVAFQCAVALIIPLILLLEYLWYIGE